MEAVLLPLVTGSCQVLCLVEPSRPMQRTAAPDAHLTHTPLGPSELPSPCFLCVQAAPHEACPAPAAPQGGAPAEAPLRGPALYLQQLQALFMKRLLTARRDRMAVVTQLLVPIALVLAALWAGRASSGFPQEPALAISRCRGPPAPSGAGPFIRLPPLAACTWRSMSRTANDHKLGAQGCARWRCSHQIKICQCCLQLAGRSLALRQI